MVYEYRCKECDEVFEVRATLAEKEKGLRPVCPSCGAREVAQVFGGVGILSSGSRRSPAAMGYGPACGPGMGAGCC